MRRRRRCSCSRAASLYLGAFSSQTRWLITLNNTNFPFVEERLPTGNGVTQLKQVTVSSRWCEWLRAGDDQFMLSTSYVKCGILPPVVPVPIDGAHKKFSQNSLNFFWNNFFQLRNFSFFSPIFFRHLGKMHFFHWKLSSIFLQISTKNRKYMKIFNDSETEKCEWTPFFFCRLFSFSTTATPIEQAGEPSRW